MGFRKIILILFMFPPFVWAQLSISYFPNGVKRSEGMLKDSIKIGVWKTWYDNKQLADSGEYVLLQKGQLFFDVAEYGSADTGAIRKDWLNKTSIENGKWISYYKNGKIMQIGEYMPFCVLKIDFIDDIDAAGNRRLLYSIPMGPTAQKTGIWKYYSEDGKLENQENYDSNGKLIEQK